MWRSLPNTPMLPGNSVSFTKLDTSFSTQQNIHTIASPISPSSPDELDVMIGFLPFDFPMAPTSQSVASRRKAKKNIPSPIDIASCSSSRKLPPASAPMPRNRGWSNQSELRGYLPSSPIDRSASVPLSAGHKPVRSTATTLRASQDMGLSRATRTALAQARNVRFDVLQSPKYSNLRSPGLRSPGYRGSMRLDCSGPLTPKTPMDMCFEDPDIAPESPISDEPMISIAPIMDTLDTIQEEDSKENRPYSLPVGGHEKGIKEARPSSLPSRARQVNREALMRLTGETPSAIDFDDDDCPPLCWRRSIEVEEEKPVLAAPAPAPRSKYVPTTYTTDRQSILGAYFHHNDSY